uniref:Uncharacterized protein n=1 Tax=Arundo donax TaxID=35708 RepID=A0A0A9EMR8_ARUDO
MAQIKVNNDSMNSKIRYSSKQYSNAARNYLPFWTLENLGCETCMVSTYNSLPAVPLHLILHADDPSQSQDAGNNHLFHLYHYPCHSQNDGCCCHLLLESATNLPQTSNFLAAELSPNQRTVQCLGLWAQNSPQLLMFNQNPLLFLCLSYQPVSACKKEHKLPMSLYYPRLQDPHDGHQSRTTRLSLHEKHKLYSDHLPCLHSGY